MGACAMFSESFWAHLLKYLLWKNTLCSPAARKMSARVINVSASVFSIRVLFSLLGVRAHSSVSRGLTFVTAAFEVFALAAKMDALRGFGYSLMSILR